MLDSIANRCNSAVVSDTVSRFRDPAPCGARSEIGQEIKRGGFRPGAGRKPKPVVHERVPGPAWFCVRTLPGLHLWADIEIRLAGFQVFNPSVWKPAYPSRRLPSGRVLPGRPDRVSPLFPGYLFTRFDPAVDNWRVIRTLPGVGSVFSYTAERPAVVPQDAIEAIRATLAPNDCAYPATRHHAAIAGGVTVRLMAGPMVGLHGLCQWSGAQRVRLLLDIMGHRVNVTVSRNNVETV